MPVRESIVIDGDEYFWDGQVFCEENQAKKEARKYLRQGFKVHMKNENNLFYIYRYRAFFCKACSLRVRT
ncbi:MAG: hypothetical protein JRJ42_07710 [Deltaproteobacteria bacterium]|nr:hypothetical protein [Deltaproteobacteria bacterium]MBW2074014.1 hypothetical protein [Deltaproteobacteria bacterium]